MANPVVVIVGAGRGLGAAIGHRYGRAGYDVALMARTESTLTQIGDEMQAAGITAGWTAVDITDEMAFREAVQRFGAHSGHINVLHFNPSAFTAKSALELTPQELWSDLHLGVASLLTAVQAARPFMSSGARITATGGGTADRPWAGAASLGVQKAALRNLVSAVDEHLSGDGIRAASITVKGNIEPGTAFDPALIAEAIYEAAQLPDEDWHSEIVYDGHAAQ